MSALTIAEIDHIAKLANLTLTDSEQKKFQAQLSEVVNFINQLNEVNTTDYLPISQTTGLENVTRKDDLIQSSLPLDGVLSGTESSYNNYFKVNAILDNK